MKVPMPVLTLCICLCSPCNSAVHTEKAWKVPMLVIKKIRKTYLHTPTIDELQWKMNGPLCFVLVVSYTHRTFQAKDSMRNIFEEALPQSLQLLNLPWSHDEVPTTRGVAREILMVGQDLDLTCTHKKQAHVHVGYYIKNCERCMHTAYN